MRKIILNENDSEFRMVYKGLPQGAVLSPNYYLISTQQIWKVLLLRVLKYYSLPGGHS